MPPPSRVEFDAETRASYWAVPVAAPGELCSPLAVARVIAADTHPTTCG
ncbi:hypothetical protein [Streptomyces antibioticus]